MLHVSEDLGVWRLIDDEEKQERRADDENVGEHYVDHLGELCPLIANLLLVLPLELAALRLFEITIYSFEQFAQIFPLLRGQQRLLLRERLLRREPMMFALVQRLLPLQARVSTRLGLVALPALVG